MAEASVAAKQAHSQSACLELLHVPGSVIAFAGLDHPIPLHRSGSEFAGRDVTVAFREQPTDMALHLSAPGTEITHIHLRWQVNVDPSLLILGDCWERSYGDLAWRGMTPERVMPWYFATFDGHRVHAYGVKTGAAALCFWQADPEGISLWLDVRNGGDGVSLGTRQLDAVTIVVREGVPDEPPVHALHVFCTQMCPSPRLPHSPIYGVNDWYYAYGNNNEQMLLQMTDLLAELAPSAGPRPFTVVDMGWKDGSAAFPSMSAYAAQVKSRGVRTGIWIRPLQAESGTDPNLLLPAARFGHRTERAKELAYDPTIPDALELIRRNMRQLSDWGFELVKHDFSTYDLLGQWGFEMGALPTIPGWHFTDRTRTNAEIITGLYTALRTVLGKSTLILGCNTVGHLGAGIFEMQRTGDDTSGRLWERTRRMGVNTLAYRLPQHNSFFHIDPDCVAITKAVPWKMTRQWLDVVVRSKTTLFVSPEMEAVSPEQRTALREAFAIFTSAAPATEPADFFHDTTPEQWESSQTVQRYRWCMDGGASPFPV
jgi:alpha-galactosidase